MWICDGFNLVSKKSSDLSIFFENQIVKSEVFQSWGIDFKLKKNFMVF